MTFNQVLECDIIELVDWAVPKFFTPMERVEVDEIESMYYVFEQMQVLTGEYSFLASCLAAIKPCIRKAKANENKELADDLIDKKEILQRSLDAVKTKQSTLSRLITVKQEINKEINMSKCG